MSLSRRRQDESRMKHRADKIAEEFGIDPKVSPRDAGRIYSTHGAECSCAMCGNPRKHFKQKSRKERMFDDDFEE